MAETRILKAAVAPATSIHHCIESMDVPAACERTDSRSPPDQYRSLGKSRQKSQFSSGWRIVSPKAITVIATIDDASPAGADSAIVCCGFTRMVAPGPTSGIRRPIGVSWRALPAASGLPRRRSPLSARTRCRLQQFRVPMQDQRPGQTSASGEYRG